jgi:predicted RNA binding protein YcfA (HicA-like mRNA interferase family)
VPSLPRITATDLLRALSRAGWIAVRQSGSHVVLKHAARPGRLVVPHHRGAILKLKTLESILDEAGLSAEELRSLL